MVEDRDGKLNSKQTVNNFIVYCQQAILNSIRWFKKLISSKIHVIRHHAETNTFLTSFTKEA